MRALAVFYFAYDPFEIRVFYEEGFLCVCDNGVKWCLPHEHHIRPTNIHTIIQYHHQAANWLEIFL